MCRCLRLYPLLLRIGEEQIFIYFVLICKILKIKKRVFFLFPVTVSSGGPVGLNVYFTSLPRVLEIASCLNSMCEKEEHEPLILKNMLTPKWNWKMSVLKNKSRAYLVSKSKGFFFNDMLAIIVCGPWGYPAIAFAFYQQPDTLCTPFFVWA